MPAVNDVEEKVGYERLEAPAKLPGRYWIGVLQGKNTANPRQEGEQDSGDRGARSSLVAKLSKSQRGSRGAALARLVLESQNKVTDRPEL